jgi:hypothetical protein
LTDLYRVLQVDPSADAEVIEAAYHRLARKFHPDVSPHPEAEARIRDLNAAYEILGHPHRRATYDASCTPRDAAPEPFRAQWDAVRSPASHRTRVRLVEPRAPHYARAVAPTPGVGPPAAPRHKRPILALATAGLATTVAAAAFSAQLFSAGVATPDAASVSAVVVVSSPYVEPAGSYEPPLRRATPAPTTWPPQVHYPAEQATMPAVDLFTRFVGAARQATRRLQGPTPPERPYNPIAP